MFDLTDDVENSPNTIRKVKPIEVNSKFNDLQEQPQVKKNEKDSKDYVNDDYHTYDVHEEDTVDDRDW